MSQVVLNNGTPLTMNAGSAYSASVTMQNSGTCVWTAASSYRLGSQNPADNGTWGGRINLSPADNIDAGASKVFNFTVTAPAAPGTYNFQWGMLQESVAWFGGLTPNLAITVIPLTGSAPSFTNTSCPDPGTAATVSWNAVANDVEYSVWYDGNTVCGFAGFKATSCNFVTTPGHHTIQVNGKDASGTWYPGTAQPLQCALLPVDDAAYVSQTGPNTMYVDQTYAVTMVMRNTGNTTWSESATPPVPPAIRLGSQAPQDNTTWGTSRIYIPAGTTVAPGQTYTFSFNVTAPSAPNTYTLQWRMVSEAVQWFGQFTPPTSIVVSRARPEITLVLSPPFAAAVQCAVSPPPSTQMTITNTSANNSQLNWNASVSVTAGDPAWLSLSPSAYNAPGAAGPLDKNKSQAITLSVSPAGLSVGGHTATLTFSDPGASNTPQIAFVSLNVVAPSPKFNLLPAGALNFLDTPQGRPNPPNLPLQISNGGDPCSNLIWKAKVISGNAWLGMVSGAGNVATLNGGPRPPDGTFDTLILAANVSALVPTTYNGQIQFTAPGAPTINDVVSATVNPPPCGGLDRMCGRVHDPLGADLPGVLVELRDANGTVQQTQTTGTTVPGVPPAPDHNYSFSGLVQGSKYFLSPVAGRNQVANPSNSSDTVPQQGIDFGFTGSVAKITATGESQMFVLITPGVTPYDVTQTNPPAVGQGGLQAAYSAVIGATGNATISVPSGSAYYITCWKGNSRTQDSQVNPNNPVLKSTPAPPYFTVRCPNPIPKT